MGSCKHKEVSDPKQLAIVKKRCECCDDNGCGAHARCSKGNPKRCECQVEGQTYPNCCNRGLSYTGQGCAKCEAAPRGGKMISRDIPLDGGWININCGTGGCITLHKVMAGCHPGANIHIHKVAHCKGKQTCNIKPTSAQFGVNCTGWRRMWITWSCNSGRDRTRQYIPRKRIQYVNRRAKNPWHKHWNHWRNKFINIGRFFG